MAAKTNNAVKDAKNEAAKLLTELEKELLNVVSSKDACDENESMVVGNQRIDKDKDVKDIVNPGSKCNSIGLEDTNITISPHQENDKDKNENLMTSQRIEQSAKTVASQFDDVLSDVDVEYL